MLEFKANLHSFVLLFFSRSPLVETGAGGVGVVKYQCKNKYMLALIYGTSHYEFTLRKLTAIPMCILFSIDWWLWISILPMTHSLIKISMEFVLLLGINHGL